MPLMNNPERRKEMKRRTCTTCVFNHEVLIFRFWQIRSPSAPSKNWPFQGRQLLLSENHLFKSCMKRFLLSRHFTLGDNTLTIHLCYIEVDNILEETLISSCLGSCSANFCAVSQFHHLLFCLGVKCRFRSMTFLFWYCIELLMPFWEETKMLSLSSATSLTTWVFRAQKQSRSNSAEVAGTVVWFGTGPCFRCCSPYRCATLSKILDRQEFTTVVAEKLRPCLKPLYVVVHFFFWKI